MITYKRQLAPITYTGLALTYALILYAQSHTWWWSNYYALVMGISLGFVIKGMDMVLENILSPI